MKSNLSGSDVALLGLDVSLQLFVLSLERRRLRFCRRQFGLEVVHNLLLLDNGGLLRRRRLLKTIAVFLDGLELRRLLLALRLDPGFFSRQLLQLLGNGSRAN